MSYYRENRRSDLSDKSFVKSKTDTEKTMCATCGHPFKRGDTVHWVTRRPSMTDPAVRPISVGVCKNCRRDATWKDDPANVQLTRGFPSQSFPSVQPEYEGW